MRRRVLKRSAIFLGLGVFVTVMVCVVLAATDDLSASNNVASAEGWVGDERWVVTRWDTPGGTRVSSQYSAGRNWSPGQALGAADTPTGGDQYTAWASAGSDSQREWLLLDFETPVVPKAVRVFEMCSTGALDKVEVFKQGDDTPIVGWQGVDPLPKGQSMGTSEVTLSGVDFPVSRVKIHFDSPNVSGWNEVDAVGLIGKDGSLQWAVGVQASSVYGSSGGTSGSPSFAGPQELAPSWAGIRPPEIRAVTFPASRATPTNTPPAPGAQQAAQAAEGTVVRPRTYVRKPDVVAEARGWPMLAMAGRREMAAVDVSAYSTQPLGSLSLTSSSLTSYPAGSFIGVTSLGTTPTRPLMLYRPIPLGFIVNSVLAGIVLWMLYWALTVPRRFVREALRMRHGCCVSCGYDLGYDFLAGCPECGWNRGRTPEFEIRKSKPEADSKFKGEPLKRETPVVKDSSTIADVR